MSDNPPLVLVVDDEVQMRRLLRITLEANGFRITDCATGRDAIAFAATERPDVVILDLGLPDMDGLDVLRRIREWSSVPVIVLTVRDDESEKISLLDGGADDYLTKPFGAGELLARIRTALRHATAPGDVPVFRSGPLAVDPSRRTVTLDGNPVRLTVTEYRLLALFVRNAGKVLTHRQIMKDVWGPHLIDETQYLRVYMAQLRRKLGDDPASPRFFQTEPGVGYRLLTGDS
jgi:two-component system, OmpR family, KDP operon response regulator KdpE